MAQRVTRAGWVQHRGTQVAATVPQLPQLDDLPLEEAVPAAEVLPGELHPHVLHARAEAEARLAQVTAEAEARLAQAIAEAERWRDHALATEADAQARGFAAGYADGMAQGRAAGEATAQEEMRAQVAQIAVLAKAARMELRAGIRAARDELAALCVAVARATIGEALRSDPDLLARRVALLLDEIGDATTAVVRVHPDDLPGLQAHWPAAARARRSGERGLRLVGDDSLAPGDCIVEGHTRSFDARLAPMLDRVATAFAALPPARVPERDGTRDDTA
jgi:flagellar assembly protein FliH